jgi:hypothetical protein
LATFFICLRKRKEIEVSWHLGQPNRQIRYGCLGRHDSQT